MECKVIIQYPTLVDRRVQVDSQTPPVDKRIYNDNLIVESERVSVGEEISARDMPRDGLIIDMPFFEGSGTVAHDCSPYGNNASLTGCYWQKYNDINILHLEETSTGTIAESDSIKTIEENKQLSFVLWVRLWESVKSRFIIFKNHSWGIFTDVSFGYLWWGICFQYPYFTGGLIVDVSGYVGKWLFLGFVYDGENYISYHSKLDYSLRKDHGHIGYDAKTGYNIVIGKYVAPALKCDLAFFKLYNRPLEDSEIEEIYTLSKELLGV